MTRKTKRILIGLGSFVALGFLSFALLVYMYFFSETLHDKASAIDCTLTWGRLEPIPASAQQFKITKHGSAFTRGFRASFNAPAADIEDWLQRSPGAREAILTTPSPGIRHFKIKPGDGAEFAEVKVDDTQNRVFIHVYWS